MKRPIIGISTDSERDPANARTHGRVLLNWNYTEVVHAAGGVPILIPPIADMEAVAPLLDGWIVPGGNDIDPAHYGQEPHDRCTLADPERFAAESALYRALPKDVPVLGICYGMQFLNVVRGGSLLQHIEAGERFGDHTLGEVQPVNFEGESRLATLVGAPVVHGSSWHHQALGTLGAGLRVTALAPDGIVEAIEDPEHPFFIGVQWHPERTPDDDATQRLMSAFIAAASQRAERA